MAGLAEVVLELQEQNRSLDDVKEGIKAMLAESIAERKKYEREAGQREEERREAKQRQRASRTTVKPPKSFTAGFGQGSGLAGLGDLIPGFMTGAGLLGGATIGGLIGTGIGRLFFPALGAFFGTQYLDKWVDPLVDKITGDDATWTMFGNQFDASKIVSGFAGALAIIFGKDAIIQTAKGLLGVGSDTKTGAMRKTFVRRLGLPAAAIAMSGVLGDAIAEMTGSQTAGDITGEVINGVSLAMMFMPGGLVIKALAGFAIAGGNLIRDYLRDRAERSKAEFMAEVEQFAKEQQLHEQSDAQLIAKAQEIATDVGTKEYFGRGSATFDPVAQEAYLKELEKRSATEHQVALLKEEIAYQLTGMRNAYANNSPSAVDFITPLQSALSEYRDLVGVDHPAASELRTMQTNLTDRVNVEPSIPFERYAQAYSQYATTRSLSNEIDRLKRVDPFAVFGPSQSQRDETQLMAQPIPGGNYLKAEQLIENFLATGQFPQPVIINNIDNSSNDTTVAKAETRMSINQEVPRVYDTRFMRMYSGYRIGGRQY